METVEDASAASEQVAALASDPARTHPWLVHQHDWKLVAVENEGSIEVREYSCRSCLGVRFE